MGLFLKNNVLLLGGTGTLGSKIIKSKFFPNLKHPKKKILNILNKKQIENLENFTINFSTEGQQTEFDNLLSPDKKKLGFKLISLIIKEL